MLFNMFLSNDFDFDGYHSFKAAAKSLTWKHGTSTFHDPQADGIIESMVGKVKEGTRTLLFQAGRPPLCWPWVVKYYCHMHNKQDDPKAKQSSPYFVRFEDHFKGERVPFGAYIEYLPAIVNHKVKEMAHKAVMAPRTCPGIFLGYVANAEGLTDDYVVIRLVDLADAKHDPNDDSSWHVTPTRSGRVILTRPILHFF